MAIGDAKRTEGDSTGTPTRMLVPVALSATAGVPVTLHYDTVGYCSAGGPFVSFKGRCDEQHGAVEFPADDGSTQLITIPIWGNPTHQPDRQFTVVLSNPVNGRISRPKATATVLDDDPVPSLVVADAQVVEGDTGMSRVFMRVTLSNPTVEDVPFRAYTTGSLATPNAEYASLSDYEGVIPAGLTSTTVEVDVYGDTELETDEELWLSVVTLSPAASGATYGTLTILSDD